jgi:hypothetical protein
MKKLTLLLFLTCSIIVAQETITTNLGDFNQLKVFSGLEVKLEKATVAKVVITGAKADQVSVKNKNGLLKLSLKFPDGFKYEDVNITLYYSNDISILDANEGAHIYSKEAIEQLNLELKVQEGARIELPVKVKYLTAKAVSGGIIDINGTSQNQTVDANTGGVYKASQVKSALTTAIASSGAIINVNATEVLDAQVNFGGTIYYKETPEELKTKKVVGGTIKQTED